MATLKCRDSLLETRLIILVYRHHLVWMASQCRLCTKRWLVCSIRIEPEAAERVRPHRAVQVG